MRRILLGVFWMAVTAMSDPAFLEKQLSYPRVRDARDHVDAQVRNRMDSIGAKWPPAAVLLRGFKQEQKLELWVADSPSNPYQLFRTYDICYVPGEPGPKRRQGDNQVPEGVYRIRVFNPVSSYHLSLGIDYPNASDRIFADKASPGGDIMIHGDCVSIGCVPITDAWIEEVYWIAINAKVHSNQDIAVHLFPMRMQGPSWDSALEAAPEELRPLWRSLATVQQDFETDRKLRSASIDASGYYQIR